MRCIFCKSDSHTSRTVEHIIPESLGNEEHVLPPGVVCDKCNNYFAREIEKPLLETTYFTQARFHGAIANKRGNIPPMTGVLFNPATAVTFIKDGEGTSISALREKDSDKFIQSIRQAKKGTIIVPIPSPPDGAILARFIGKVALEALASRFISHSLDLNEIVDKAELDDLRQFVRIGGKNIDWPVHQRRIYTEDFNFYEEGYGSYVILHEFDFLYTEAQELYFVVAIFGIEYVLNMGERTLDGYLVWLKQHNNQSPLYQK